MYNVVDQNSFAEFTFPPLHYYNCRSVKDTHLLL